MTTRRRLILGGAGMAIAGLLPRAAGAQAILTDDGIYRQPWFLESFLELGDDLDGAAKAGKRFAVMWELRGCPYCKETHLVNFADPKISAYVKANFEILQLNVVGSRKVTDFDGKELGEKQIAAKYGVRFTPTIQFFPEASAGLRERPPEKREVARAAGYYRPDDFLAVFRYVREKAYEQGSFRDYLKARG